MRNAYLRPLRRLTDAHIRRMYALATVKFFFFKCAAAAGVWVHRVTFDRTVVVGGSAINVAA